MASHYAGGNPRFPELRFGLSESSCGVGNWEKVLIEPMLEGSYCPGIECSPPGNDCNGRNPSVLHDVAKLPNRDAEFSCYLRWERDRAQQPIRARGMPPALLDFIPVDISLAKGETLPELRVPSWIDKASIGWPGPEDS